MELDCPLWRYLWLWKLSHTDRITSGVICLFENRKKGSLICENIVCKFCRDLNTWNFNACLCVVRFRDWISIGPRQSKKGHYWPRRFFISMKIGLMINNNFHPRWGDRILILGIGIIGVIFSNYSNEIRKFLQNPNILINIPITIP